MPELPEVETIRGQLVKYLRGHRIEAIQILTAKSFPGDKEKLIGGRVVDMRRFGKVLVGDLDNGYSFLVHLKLTGQLIYDGEKLHNQPNNLTRVIFTLDKKARLFFNDSRKFGWIKTEKTSEVEKESFIKKLGPEPFGLTPVAFGAILATTRRPVKVFLLDQEKISGVGNIYANDALWLARIHPGRPANSLNTSERSELLKALQEVLEKGIKYQGASDQWYLTAEGKKGSYQDHFLTYGKQGVLCPRCQKAKFIRTVLGGRGTFFCPNCQKKQ